MCVFSVMVVLSMPPRLQRGYGSSCRCLGDAAYTRELKQALCHRRAEDTHFFIVPCTGTLICLIYDTYVMSNGLPLARMPGGSVAGIRRRTLGERQRLSVCDDACRATDL